MGIFGDQLLKLVSKKTRWSVWRSFFKNYELAFKG
jgi:hypothetical protein